MFFAHRQDRADMVIGKTVINLFAVAPVLNELVHREYLQLMGYGRLRHRKAFGKILYAVFLLKKFV